MDLHCHRRPWPSLCNDILALILGRLKFADLVRFVAACKSFRRAAANSLHFQSLQFPWLLYPPDSSSETWCLFSPLERRNYCFSRLPIQFHRCFGSCRGWLSSTDSMRGDYLLNPFTNRRIQLPEPRGFVKAILSSRSCPRNLTTAGCVIVAIDGVSRLVFCRAGDQQWSVVGGGWLDHTQFYDVVSFRGLLYCLTTSHKLFAFEFGPQPVCRSAFLSTGSRRIRSVCDGIHRQSFYLVELAGELLMVIRYQLDYKLVRTVHFDVYRFDFGHQIWVEMTRLGDWALLLGEGRSVSVNTKNFPRPGFRGSCIYFMEAEVNEHMCREFCLEDKDIRPFSIENAPSAENPPRLFVLNA